MNDAHVWMGEHFKEDAAYANASNESNNEYTRNISFSEVGNYGSGKKQLDCNGGGINTNINRHKRTTVTQNYYIPGLKARERTWIYERNFSIPVFSIKEQGTIHDNYDDNDDDIYKPTYVLVVEGIKMGAMIEINEMFLGNVTNQFKRYMFPIPNNYLTMNKSITEEHQGIHLRHRSWQQQRQHHQIRISFIPEIDTNGRFMACSGGWDWAPYTQNAEASCLSRRVFTFGIVKPIYIAKLSTRHPMIADTIPKIYYLGDKKCVRNTGSSEVVNHNENLSGDFQLVVNVHLNLPFSFNNDNAYDIVKDLGELEQGEVIFRASFLETDETVSMKNGNMLENGTFVVTFQYIVKRKSINLWWPQGAVTSGTSSPQLYSLKVAYHNPMQGIMSQWIEKKIGELCEVCQRFLKIGFTFIFPYCLSYRI